MSTTVVESTTDPALKDTVLQSFTVASSGETSASAELFTDVKIAGFVPTSKIQGAGTSSVTLKSADALISVTDNVNSLLVIKATGSADQEVTFDAPAGVTFNKRASANIVDVQSSAAGAVSGAIVLVSAKGEASVASGSSIAATTSSQAKATLKSDTQLIFRANSEYSGSADVSSYNQAVVEAIASARLAGEATTEFSSGASLLANANYFSSASAKTEAKVENRVTTQVKAAANAAAAASAAASGGYSLAYDLDYVNVPAQSASNVAVYVNGALATRVNTPAEVNTKAAGSAESYYATTSEGRVLVLASTATRASASTITIASVPDASVAAKTLAQLDAQLGVTSQVQGSFNVLGNLQTSAEGSGQVIGSFDSFFASEAKGDANVESYSDVRSSTEIFAKIDFAAHAAADATASVTSAASAGASGASAANMDTSVASSIVASATFTDAVYSSIVAEAKAATTTRWTLGSDVSATAISDTVARIDGPKGTLGYLFIAKADGSAASTSKLDTNAAADAKAAVEARLAAGESIIFRGSAEAQAKVNAEIIAKAVAAGQVASEVNVGIVANAVSSANVDYTSSVDAAVNAAASHRGTVQVDVTGKVQQATAVVLTADRPSLPAASASDILVSVNGQAATQASTAAEVFAAASAAASASAGAKYFVQTNLQGQTQIITSLPNLAANVASKVVVTSKLEADARAKAALDVFGSFKAGYGGAATGSIVSMVAKPDAGLILDYTVATKSKADVSAATTNVFDAVKVGSSAFAQASASSANSIRFTNEQAVLEAFDTSSAVMKITATAQTTANFDLGSNIQARSAASGVLMLTSSDFVGALILTKAEGGAAAGSSFNTAASAQGEITANLAAGSQVIFKAFSGFEAELTAAEQQAQAEAIAKGQLLGQVIVDTNAATSATATANVNYYANVAAVTKVASAEKIEILVDSASQVGKSIVISLDRETVSGLIKGEAELLVDGKVVSRASNYQDALKPDADKYWLITTEGEVGLQAIVTLSHFSTRTITLQTPPPPSIYLYTTIGLGVVVAAQAILPRIRRKW
ncbi:MAG: hypothetical protein HY556_11975 [Euryarchaeota archaeon]|nr:hypothetical protein [Euryarchaeota archaeon]